MSDEHYPEFTSAQTERLDEIDNAVYQTILAFLNKSEDEFPWDMYYIGEVAECIEETLLSMGQRVHRPVIVTGKDGISRKTGHDFAAAVNSVKFPVFPITAELQSFLDDGREILVLADMNCTGKRNCFCCKNSVSIA